MTKVSVLSILACVATITEGGYERRVTVRKFTATADISSALLVVPETDTSSRNLDHKKNKNKNKNNKSSSGGKRLMMYCEKKFMWQNKKSCPQWCLTASSCKAGSSVRIRRCGSSSSQKWKSDNGVLRPTCSNSLSVSNGKLVKGSEKLSGLGKSRFEIRKGSKCFTQQHHPKVRKKL